MKALLRLCLFCGSVFAFCDNEDAHGRRYYPSAYIDPEDAFLEEMDEIPGMEGSVVLNVNDTYEGFKKIKAKMVEHGKLRRELLRNRAEMCNMQAKRRPRITPVFDSEE